MMVVMMVVFMFLRVGQSSRHHRASHKGHLPCGSAQTCGVVVVSPSHSSYESVFDYRVVFVWSFVGCFFCLFCCIMDPIELWILKARANWPIILGIISLPAGWLRFHEKYFMSAVEFPKSSLLTFDMNIYRMNIP